MITHRDVEVRYRNAKDDHWKELTFYVRVPIDATVREVLELAKKEFGNTHAALYRGARFNWHSVFAFGPITGRLLDEKLFDDPWFKNGRHLQVNSREFNHLMGYC